MRLLLALLALATPLLLSAQSPAQRDDLERLRDSLVGVSDSVSLIALEHQLIQHASRELRDSAIAHLRLGFVALRLGDLAGRKHYEDAASEFQWAADLQAKWPYPWLGLGFAELGVGDADFAPMRGLQTALGKDALTRSANDFARSAEVDPSFVRGLVELSNIALRQRINLRLGVALAALRRAAHTPAGRHPDVMLARARVEREAGSPDSALAAIDALAAQGAPSAIVLLEVARERFLLGRVNGDEPWYRGLAIADGAALAAYRADLQFILADSTMRAFDATDGPGRVRLMQAFWQLRDRDELHRNGQRLAEHYRRLNVAQREFRLVSTRRHYDIVERYRPAVLDFDDRGVIYIRHGAPSERASSTQPGLPVNESWVYRRPGDQDLLFHFVARESITDFRLVESVLDVLDFERSLRVRGSGELHDPSLAVGGRGLGAISRDSAARLRQRATDIASSHQAEALLQARAALNPIYSRMLAAGRATEVGLEATERALGRRSIDVGTTTDSWLPEFPVTLPLQMVAIGAGGDSLSSPVHLAWAIPASSVPARELTAGALAPRVRVSIIGPDSANPVVDTLMPAADPATIGSQRYYLGELTVPAPAATVTVRMSIESNRAGAVTDRDTIIAGAPAGMRWELTDLGLGSHGIGRPMPLPGGDTLWLNPTGLFPAAQPMELYAEVSGLARGTSYKTVIEIRPLNSGSVFSRIGRLFGGGGHRIRLGSTDRAASGTARIVREISALKQLPPGQYVMEVTVSLAARERRVRRQSFTIVP